MQRLTMRHPDYVRVIKEIYMLQSYLLWGLVSTNAWFHRTELFLRFFPLAKIYSGAQKYLSSVTNPHSSTATNLLSSTAQSFENISHFYWINVVLVFLRFPLCILVSVASIEQFLSIFWSSACKFTLSTSIPWTHYFGPEGSEQYAEHQTKIHFS